MDPAPSDRVLTVPNALSALRLAGVPVFLVLVLVLRSDTAVIAAVGVLVVAGVTDWLDGVLARALDQTSRLGVLLDPLADRLYIVATLVAFLVRDVVPWWVAAIVVGRDLVLTLTLPVLRRHGHGPLPVHFIGKAATFNLLYAFPLLLLTLLTDSGGRAGTVAAVAAPVGWAFAIWGIGLYCWSGALYLRQVAAVVAAARRRTGVTGGRDRGRPIM